MGRFRERVRKIVFPSRSLAFDTGLPLSPGTDDTDAADVDTGPPPDSDGDGRTPQEYAAHLERYDAIRFTGDHTIISDVENERAWVQSETALDLDAVA